MTAACSSDIAGQGEVSHEGKIVAANVRYAVAGECKCVRTVQTHTISFSLDVIRVHVVC
jgi:hypothetical protein